MVEEFTIASCGLAGIRRPEDRLLGSRKGRFMPTHVIVLNVKKDKD